MLGKSPFIEMQEHFRTLDEIRTYTKKIEAVSHLNIIDEEFIFINKNYLNFFKSKEIHFFVQRCHSAFLCGSYLILSGALYEAQFLMRGCLEFSGYSAAFIFSQELKNAWKDKKNNKSTVTKLTRTSEISGFLEKIDTNLGGRYKILHEETINFGAHPNLPGIDLGRVKHNDNLEELKYTENNSVIIEESIKRLFDCASFCLDTFHSIIRKEGFNIDRSAYIQSVKDFDNYMKLPLPDESTE